MVFDLMFALDATEEQLDFPILYGSAKYNWMSADWKEPTDNIYPLLDAIIEHIPAPKSEEGTLQMLITSLDYSPYTGRIAVGRINRGSLSEGMSCLLAHRDGSMEKVKIKEIHTFEGMGHKKVRSVDAGDICAIVGLESFEIGDTVCDADNPEPLPPIDIDEPTMSMLFSINDSPFFGKEGKYVTSRHIQERLNLELDKNLALRVKPAGDESKWIVFGRGVLHLSILIETMRRDLEQSRVEAELQNLKSQLNPHFLFNTLNNIYCLIAFSPDRAQGVVHDLSRLLRYVLYDSNQKFVPLGKELDFIRNYVELMRIRLPEHVSLDLQISGQENEGGMIAAIIYPYLYHV